ncbi:MAG: protein kinase [bacterium]
MEKLRNKDVNDESVTDTTLLREDMTVMRDPSETTGTNSQVSWRSSSGTGNAASDETPKVLKQRFVLEELIGSGGMGSVFRAKDLRKVEARGTQPYVAVKILNNDFRHHPEAFIALEREASKSQGLRHSNIVSIFDFDKDDDVPFITMELLQGEELADLLKAYPSGLPEELAWKLIEGMVLGLKHAHEEEVVHADFKPGNIFVTQKKVAKILDFGIARAMRMNAGSEDTEFDPARLAALTPAYASREMLNGDNPEPRDDIFSLGIVIYMILTGHHPYGRVPANDAAREGLKPERIKSLSRRRWRILEKSLQLNRQDRPADVQEVFAGLFAPSPWRNWSLVATAGLVTASLLLVVLQDSASISEVKEEVRQETLVDAQMSRIQKLLDEPAFDTNWERQLFAELQTLRALSPAMPLSNDATATAQTQPHELISARITQLYADHIRSIEDLSLAFAQFEAGKQFTALPQVRDELQLKLLYALDNLAAEPITGQWLDRFELLQQRSDTYFSRSTLLAAAQMDVVDHAAQQLREDLIRQDIQLAQQTWRKVEEKVFDADLAQQLQTQFNTALSSQQAEKAAELHARTAQRLQQQLSRSLSVSCLRVDVGQLATQLDNLIAGHPDHADQLREQIGARLGECISRLGAVDPDRAYSLKKQALARFGAMQQLQDQELDPCSLHYLVGNGNTRGRGSFCADQVSKDQRGPRLVVVPGGQSLAKFAISKYEISWRDVNLFCAETRLCTPAQEEHLPVTGLAVETVEAYARWLTEHTGYTYRLPTALEWQQAAQGEPDPNRNCRIDVGGVRRGDAMLASENGAANPLGLVHVLGNAQELVKDNSSYVARGGTYSDPIERCQVDTQREIAAQGDAQTGFRLVREVS